MTVSKKNLIAYSFLAVPISILAMPPLIYLPAFYAGEQGLGLATVGIVFMAARILDGIADIVVGVLSDRTQSRMGRRKPWIMAGIPMLFISCWFLLMPPQNAGILYLLVWILAFYISWTVIQIPYLAWGVELASGYKDSNRVVAFREIGTMIGNLTAAAFPLFILASDASLGSILEVFSITAMTLLLASGFIIAFFLKDPPVKTMASLKLEKYVEILKIGLFQRLLSALCLNWIALGILNAVIVFIVDQILGLRGAFLELFFILYIIAIGVVPFMLRIANGRGKHRAYSFGLLALIIPIALMLIVPPSNYGYAIFIFAFMGLGFCCINVLPMALMADVIDYDTLKSRDHRAGIFTALYNLAMKLSTAIGVGGSFLLLESAGFSANGANDKNALEALGLIGCLLPIGLFLCSACVLWGFPINQKRHDIIRRRINRMKLT